MPWRDNRRRGSPLHSAIAAAGTACVHETEDKLLELIDYHLDGSGFPMGESYGGGYLYPAASALVNIRIPRWKILRALSRTDQPRRQSLLCWVLISLEHEDIAQHLLEYEQASRTNDKDAQRNLSKAIDLLKANQHVSDLLPPILPPATMPARPMGDSDKP